MNKFVIFVIKLYKKVVSPILESLFGHACRFTPSCSAYTITSLERFGLVKGLTMGLKRVSKCHPWGGTGYDPVPNLKK